MVEGLLALWRLAGEAQPEIADLDLVTTRQRQRVDSGGVDVGAVEAAGVDDPVLTVEPAELGVATADGDVVEKHRGVGVAPGGRGGFDQQEPGLGEGPRTTSNTPVPASAPDAVDAGGCVRRSVAGAGSSRIRRMPVVCWPRLSSACGGSGWVTAGLLTLCDGG